MDAVLDEAGWLTLCVYEEAGGEPADGQAAVARVILNRTRLHYSSAGTIESTVTWPSQFSWCEYDWISGRYERACSGGPAIHARAQKLLAAAQAHTAVWGACARVADQVRRGVYAGGAGYRALGDDAVLYANLALSRPAWARPLKPLAVIGRHTFYRDPAADAGRAGAQAAIAARASAA